MLELKHGQITPGACRRCGGAGYFDGLDGDWRCLLCGRATRPQPRQGQPPNVPVAA